MGGGMGGMGRGAMGRGITPGPGSTGQPAMPGGFSAGRGFVPGGSLPPVPPAKLDAGIATLTEFGFSPEEAKTALEKCVGKLDLAISFLTGELSEANLRKITESTSQLHMLRMHARSSPETMEKTIQDLLQNTELQAKEAQQPGFTRNLLMSDDTGMGEDEEEEQVRELTVEDEAHIKEIVELGFTEEQAKEAYVKGGRNVQLAVNRLLGA